MCFCCLCDLLIYIVSKIYHLLTQWPFIVLLIVLILKEPISKSLKEIGVISFGKDGVELKKMVQEAKNTINEAHLLARSVYVPLLDMLARAYLQTAHIIKDKLNCRLEIEKYINANIIDDKTLQDKVNSLNDSIISDVLFSIVKKHEGSLLELRFVELLNEDTKSRNYKCQPDIEKITNFLKEENLLDNDNTKYILEEAEYFIGHKNFKDIDKLIDCMNKSMQKNDD